MAACIAVGRPSGGDAHQHTDKDMSVGDKSFRGTYAKIRWIVKDGRDGRESYFMGMVFSVRWSHQVET